MRTKSSGSMKDTVNRLEARGNDITETAPLHSVCPTPFQKEVGPADTNIEYINAVIKQKR